MRFSRRYICPAVKNTQKNKDFDKRADHELPIPISTRIRDKSVYSDSLVEEERSFHDDKESMWVLSSNCLPPLSFSKEYGLLSDNSFYFSVDQWLISWLSLFFKDSYFFLGEEVTLFYGFGISPTERASLALKDAEKYSDKDLMEEKVVNLLPSSTPEDENAIDISDSSEVAELEKNSYLVSLVNLDTEDSKLIPDSELEFDDLKYDFPSPSCNTSCSSFLNNTQALENETLQYDFSSENAREEDFFEDSDIHEPLFWPFDCEAGWSSEKSWNCFSMSPRKNMKAHPTPRSSTEFKFHCRKLNHKEGAKRSLNFSSKTDVPRLMELNQRHNIGGVRRIRSAPSRLSKSTKKHVKIVPLETNDDVVEDRKDPNHKFIARDKEFLEEDFGSNDELSIEKFLGLDEFDGHEGVDSEFDNNDFSLDESLG